VAEARARGGRPGWVALLVPGAGGSLAVAHRKYPPGTLRLLPVVAAAEGRIHFAGEHTSPWPGWIQGAIHSGLRAAREAVAAT